MKYCRFEIKGGKISRRHRDTKGFLKQVDLTKKYETDMSEPEGSAESFTIQARRGQTPAVCGGQFFAFNNQADGV